MKNLYEDSRELDALAQKQAGLSEDLMMENAAAAMEKAAKSLCKIKKSKILILTGSGNNGGDGWALARRLYKRAQDVQVLECKGAKSPMCLLQKERALKTGIEVAPSTIDFNSFDLIVDCIFGAGFHGNLPEDIQSLTSKANAASTKKLACDIPSGIDKNGKSSPESFCADITVTMGALKTGLFSDMAKDLCGKIKIADLGISPAIFENPSVKVQAYLLEKKDLKIPLRKKQNVNKGSFGHTAVALGQKAGAGIIAASAAFRFGSGLVTLVNPQGTFSPASPIQLMTSTSIPQKTSALALGMGLGLDSKDLDFYFDFLVNNKNLPAVIDADIFYSEKIKDLLQTRAQSLILTPHPKEFSALLYNCGLGKFSVSEILENKLNLTKEFCKAFPGAVLLLKGSNVLICSKKDKESPEEIFINPLGTSALAKGGSGDVLAGLIAALLAQSYQPLQAAINASLAHALGGRRFKNSYSLTPQDLIVSVAKLQDKIK